MKKRVSSSVSSEYDIAVTIKPHPENTYYQSSSSSSLSASSGKEPAVLYYQQPEESKIRYPSFLEECLRYFELKPPSNFFFNSTKNQLNGRNSQSSSFLFNPHFEDNKKLAGTKLNDKAIFRFKLSSIGSVLRDLSKLPYFNYEEKFHYEYHNFSFLRRLASMALIVYLGTFSKFFLNVANSCKFYGKEKFRATIEEHYESVQKEMKETPVTTSLSEPKTEKKIRGLLTVVNHNSMLDEPILMSGLAPMSWFFKSDIIRYAVCASDMCFGHFLLGEFFKTVKVLPIKRAGGLEQSAMKLIVHKLSTGGWLNIFPEGRIYVDGEVHQCRRGIGKLIYDCEVTPYIYPIYHKGLPDVLPYDGIVPRVGKHITIMFGDEIVVDDIIQKGRNKEITEDEVYVQIAARVEEGMKQLKRNCDAQIEKDKQASTSH